MRRLRIALILLTAFQLGLKIAPGSEQMPHITGESLSGKEISLPPTSPGYSTVICIGFSHASHSQVDEWEQRATEALSQRGGVTIYSIAVLEDAPRVVRGMAVHAMRNGVALARRDRFIVVYHGESELKRVTGFNRPEDAYVLLLDGSGKIRWTSHGAVSDNAVKQLIDQVLAIQGTR